MAVTNLGTGIAATGTTAAVAVPASRNYVVQSTGAGSTVQVQGSLDGSNFFDMSTGVRLSNATGWAFRYTDQQVTHMRVNVTSYGGTPFNVNVMDI